MCFCAEDTFSHAVENPTHQVKGIMGASVLFPANISQGITVEKMEWDFYPKSGGLGFWLGEFSHGKLEHPSPTDRFGQRLDMVNETTLRIKDLELDDGGIYNARIWFMKSRFQEQSFNLTVYEPVPTPQVLHQEVSSTPEECNVTLQCQTPGREELKVFWETGNPPRALESSLDEFQLSDNGRQLHVSWETIPFDSTFTCLVSNPVSEKRASFDLFHICSSIEGERNGTWENLRLILGLSAGFLLGLLAIVVIICQWRKMRQRGRTICINFLPVSPGIEAPYQYASTFVVFIMRSRIRSVPLNKYSFSCYTPQKLSVCFRRGEFFLLHTRTQKRGTHNFSGKMSMQSRDDAR
ncbi:SLAM family member 5 isoform X3 [Zootoca vivipara]|uniref:SLAM family member 5 isoform X3 n=1 Tax=Zootoca vivipara TaxID=8524 RepID=UPI00293BB919|nr:SLAM family member 5 isoform X3 [Zootoca vivipara]XP_060125674.1 SLAM family member 5 isoform X3 [Zootoca vivipara]